MRLVVLGASGGCGKELVIQGAERGWDVVAVTRPSSKVSLPAGVTHVTGDLCDEAFLRTALVGADAVASALGLRMPGIAPWAKAEDPTFLARSTPAIVAAMKAAGVKRLIAVSAGGVGDSAPNVPGVFRAFIALSALRKAYVELERMEAVYMASGLDVCMVRPGGLTDGPRTGRAVAIDAMRGPASISRADVACWMLDQLGAPVFSKVSTLIGI